MRKLFFSHHMYFGKLDSFILEIETFLHFIIEKSSSFEVQPNFVTATASWGCVAYYTNLGLISSAVLIRRLVSNRIIF